MGRCEREAGEVTAVPGLSDNRVLRCRRWGQRDSVRRVQVFTFDMLVFGLTVAF